MYPCFIRDLSLLSFIYHLFILSLAFYLSVIYRLLVLYTYFICPLLFIIGHFYPSLCFTYPFYPLFPRHLSIIYPFYIVIYSLFLFVMIR